MKFADTTTDFAFKKIFGSADHKNVLIGFLNAILDLPAAITQTELANPYQIPKIAELKDTVLDIRATDQNGQHFIVEMQVQYAVKSRGAQDYRRTANELTRLLME
jgi:predicted transposase/invertase (TIGR01784 family)